MSFRDLWRCSPVHTRQQIHKHNVVARCHFLLSPSFYSPVNISLPRSLFFPPAGPACHICSASIISTHSCQQRLTFHPQSGASMQVWTIIEILNREISWRNTGQEHMCIQKTCSCLWNVAQPVWQN